MLINFCKGQVSIFCNMYQGRKQIHLGTRSLWESTDIKDRRICNSSRSELVTEIWFASPPLSLRSLWCSGEVTEFRETNPQYSRDADSYQNGLKKEKQAMTQSIAKFQWFMHDMQWQRRKGFLIQVCLKSRVDCPALWSSAIKDRTSGRVLRSVTHQRLKGLIAPSTLQQLWSAFDEGVTFVDCSVIVAVGWRWRVPTTECVQCIKPERESIVRQKIHTLQISRTPQRLVTLRLLRGGGGTELVLPF